MKLLSRAILLVGAEQAYAHAELIQFSSEDAASAVLIPVSLIMLVLGTLFMIWGLLTESRSGHRQKSMPGADAGTGQCPATWHQPGRQSSIRDCASPVLLRF